MTLGEKRRGIIRYSHKEVCDLLGLPEETVIFDAKTEIEDDLLLLKIDHPSLTPTLETFEYPIVTSQMLRDGE